MHQLHRAWRALEASQDRSRGRDQRVPEAARARVPDERQHGRTSPSIYTLPHSPSRLLSLLLASYTGVNELMNRYVYLTLQLMGDDPTILDEDTNREIQKMRCVYFGLSLSLSRVCTHAPVPN